MPLSRSKKPSPGPRAKKKSRRDAQNAAHAEAEGRPNPVRTSKPSTVFGPGQNTINDRQRVFISSYITHLDGKRAALESGSPNDEAASKLANQYLSGVDYPLVAQTIERELSAIHERARFKAEDVLRIIQTAAFMDRRAFFEPGEIKDGTWTIREADFLTLPSDVARIIKVAERQVEWVQDPDAEPGTLVPRPTGTLKVKLLDQETMVALVGKVMLGDKVNQDVKLQINWADMTRIVEAKAGITSGAQVPVTDPIEMRILQLAQGKSSSEGTSTVSVATSPVSGGELDQKSESVKVRLDDEKSAKQEMVIFQPK